MPKLHNLNSKFDPQVPHDGSRELAPSRCPLTSTHTKRKCDITTIKEKKKRKRRRKAVFTWTVPHPHPLTPAFPCTPEPFQPQGLSSDCSGKFFLQTPARILTGTLTPCAGLLPSLWSILTTAAPSNLHLPLPLPPFLPPTYPRRELFSCSVVNLPQEGRQLCFVCYFPR